MATLKKRSNFVESEEGIDIIRILEEMMANSSYNTVSIYNANSLLYPDNRMSFVAKHVSYLNAHPNLDPKTYIANLQLMTRIR